MSGLAEEVPIDTRPDRGGHKWTSETAREAGKKGGKARRRTRQELELLEGAVPGDGKAAAAGVARPQDDAVVRRLQAKAEAGDVAAARELREWRRLDPAAELTQDALRLGVLITQLSAAARRRLLDLVLDVAKDAANDGIREGSVESDQTLRSTESRQPEGHPRAASESRAGAPEAPRTATDDADEQLAP